MVEITKFSRGEAGLLRGRGIRYFFGSNIHPEAGQLLAQRYQQLTSHNRIEASGFSIDIASRGDKSRGVLIDNVFQVEETADGFVLNIHIADLGFIPPGSKVDSEARKRVESIYLPRTFVPMLPALITKLASLDQGKENLAVTFEIHLDTAGKIVNVCAARSVVKNEAALDYEAADIAMNKGDDLGKQIKLAHRLALLRLKNRVATEEGFDPQTGWIIDRLEQSRRLLPAEQRQTRLIVEEFGVLAGEAARKFLYSGDWVSITAPMRRYLDILNQRMILGVLDSAIEREAEERRLLEFRNHADQYLPAAYTVLGQIDSGRKLEKAEGLRKGDFGRILEEFLKDETFWLFSIYRKELVAALRERGENISETSLAHLFFYMDTYPSIKEFLAEFIEREFSFNYTNTLLQLAQMLGWSKPLFVNSMRRWEVGIRGKRYTTQNTANKRRAAYLFLRSYFRGELVGVK